MRFPLIAAICVLMLPDSSTASVVVALRSGDRIIVGADGKGITKSLADTSFEQTAADTCKLFTVGKTVVAVTGIKGDLSGFHATDVILPLASLRETLPRTADRIMSALKGPVEHALIKQPDGQYVGALFHVGDVAISVLLARFDSGIASVATRDLMFSQIKADTVTFTVRATDCPGDCPSNRPGVFTLGSREAIDDYFTGHPIGAKWMREVSSAFQLLDLEAVRHPETVGAPFSVVSLGKDALNWVQNGACTP